MLSRIAPTHILCPFYVHILVVTGCLICLWNHFVSAMHSLSLPVRDMHGVKLFLDSQRNISGKIPVSWWLKRQGFVDKRRMKVFQTCLCAVATSTQRLNKTPLGSWGQGPNSLVPLKKKVFQHGMLIPIFPLKPWAGAHRCLRFCEIKWYVYVYRHAWAEPYPGKEKNAGRCWSELYTCALSLIHRTPCPPVSNVVLHRDDTEWHAASQ